MCACIRRAIIEVVGLNSPAMQPEAGIVYDYASDPQHVLPHRRTRHPWSFPAQCLARPEYLPLLVAFGEILRRRDDAGQGMNQQYVLQQQQSQQQMQAQQQAHMIYLQQQQQAQKGTLVPGQQIQIQNLTVTVERFLSQGILFNIYQTLLVAETRQAGSRTSTLSALQQTSTGPRNMSLSA